MTGQATVEWAPVIAATKLRAPRRRPDLVPRLGLVGELRGARERKLTLIAAPPGCGKTTLLTLWQADPAEDRPFAWLSLDESDNDPVRFWTGVIAALRTVAPAIARPAEAALRTPATSLADVTVPLIINELDARAEPLVLILDDLHLVADARVHQSLALLLEHLPPAVQLTIATRTDPPLGIGRLRARDELTEIRAAALRFSDEEATTLLNGSLGLELTGRQIALLQNRTEGWAAGLQLAGLSLRDRGEPDDFIASFTGDDRQIVDYLGPEVLDRQPRDVRGFLVRTSILDRLCGSLCDALTGDEDGALRLEQLEHANLPLVALDDRRGWYRYHHLFAELLRHVLEAERPAEVAGLHARAAAWHRAHGEVELAIHHSFAAGDLAIAHTLVAENWLRLFNRGELATVAGWLAALPAELAERDARLWLARVWTALDSGRLADVEPLLEAAAREATGERAAWAAVLRALHIYKAGDVGAALRVAMEARDAWAEPTAFWRTVAAIVVGVASYWSDDVPAAEAALAGAVRLAEIDDNPMGRVYSLSYLAALRVDRGRFAEAEEILARVDALLASDSGAAEQFTTLVAHLARARLHEHRHESSAAAREASRAVELARRGAGLVERAAALLAHADALRALGARDDAAAALDEARMTLAACPDPGRLAGHANPPAPVGRQVAEPDPLSERELAVLRLLPGPLSQREIGQELYVSLNTVKTHTRNIYAKLHAANREEAVGRAREEGLI